MRKRPLALALLLLATPAAAQITPVHCPTVPELETTVFSHYLCRVEIEPGRVLVLEFRLPLTAVPSIAIRGDYANYPGTEGVIAPCITHRLAYLREDRLRVRVTSTCEEDKYVLVELTVPR